MTDISKERCEQVICGMPKATWPTLTRDVSVLITALRARVEELEEERGKLIAAVGEHITVRSDYLSQIDALRASLAEALEVVRPFAEFHIGVSALDNTAAAFGTFHHNNEPLRVRHFRRARAFLAKHGASDDPSR